MIPAQGLFAKKAYLLIPLLLLLIAFLLAFNYLYLPWADRCVFENPSICLKGRKYQKYNWTGKGFLLDKPQKVRAPFSGDFVYSPSGTMNYEGKQVGETGVIVFESENLGMIKLYVGGANLLKGKVAVQQSVKMGEIVAEALPKGIEFLDNYSAVEIRMTK
jgi:hypothetical protein